MPTTTNTTITKQAAPAALTPSRSAHALGLTHLARSTGSGWGATRRSYKRSERATAIANVRHHLALRRNIEVQEIRQRYSVEDLTPALSPRLNAVLGFLAGIVEFVLGASLGWSLGGGDDPFLTGAGYLGPIIFAAAFGGVFAVAAVSLAEGLGKSLGRFLSLSDDDDGAQAVLARTQRRVRVALVLVTALGFAALFFYFVANKLRESLVATPSIAVDANEIALLGVLVPLGLSLVKAHWHSRPAAVRAHELETAFQQSAYRFAFSLRRAESRRADILARSAHIVALASLADANQTGGSAELTEQLLKERMPLTDLTDGAFPSPELNVFPDARRVTTWASGAGYVAGPDEIALAGDVTVVNVTNPQAPIAEPVA